MTQEQIQALKSVIDAAKAEVYELYKVAIEVHDEIAQTRAANIEMDIEILVNMMKANK